MRRSADTTAPRLVRLIRLAAHRFWKEWSSDAEYRRRFGASMCRRCRNSSTTQGAEVVFVAWLFFVLSWLMYARITGQ
jgi:hypothetical protein